MVTHPNTTQARSGLITEIGWDPVISSWYGHNQLNLFFKQINQQNKFNSQKDYNTWTSQVVTNPSTAQVRPEAD